MDEKNTNWRANSEDGVIRRICLKDVLPLDTPLTLNVEASAFCCLKCNYCPQSLSDEWKKEHGIGYGFMDINVFKKLLNQCVDFPEKIKTLRFAGFGEPLLNKDLDRMVKMAKDSELFESITIFSNGVPMDKNMAERLADSGVDTILFDIQGLCDEDYYNVANMRIDFKRLIENISYLHSFSGYKGRIFIKTFKYIVHGREQEFYDLFKDISDDQSIDDIYEQCKEIDFNGMITEVKESIKLGFTTTDYCSYPWYHLSVAANGNVQVCCAPVSYSDQNLQLGNICSDSIFDMWKSRKMYSVRKTLLNGIDRINGCTNCDYPNNIPKEDRIDDIRDYLIKWCDRGLFVNGNSVIDHE